MVKIDFKQVLTVLYDEFGDQGIAWVQKQIATRLSDTPDVESEEESADPSEESTPVDRGTDYADADSFSADVRTEVERLSISSIRSPEQVVEAVLGLVVMAGEVRKFEEAQVTKRVGIAAQRDIALANIHAQQELLKDYLERSFDERAENFNRLFAAVDDALASNNMAALAMGLESVVKLATSSPFKDLRTVEETAAALADPGHEWDF